MTSFTDIYFPHKIWIPPYESKWIGTPHEDDMRMKYAVDHYDWIKDADPGRCVWGKNLAEIIREKRGWKTGDLKNGWKSISINGHKVKEYTHLLEPLTEEWEGMTVSWTGTTYVIRDYLSLIFHKMLSQKIIEKMAERREKITKLEQYRLEYEEIMKKIIPLREAIKPLQQRKTRIEQILKAMESNAKKRKKI